MRHLISLITLIALPTTSAWAYVPEYSTILSHAAEQHGKGVYQIEQEVTFRKQAEAFTVKETWLVGGEGNLRLTLEGRGGLKGLVGGTIIYEPNTKFFTEAGQGLRQQRLGDDWLEPLFHFRSSRWLRNRLVALHVTSAESLKDREPLNSEGEPHYEPPSFIRLSRAGGSIAWAIGVPPSVGTAPTVWIEQDQFVLRKYRSANQTTLRADDYAKYSDGLWYPRTRTYTFGDYTVTVQTLGVQALGKIAINDLRFKPASLTPAKDSLRLPDTEGLREFYSRFR